VSGARTYSVEEANAAIADLRPRLARIRDARHVVISAGERIRDAVASDGGGREGAAYWKAIRVLRAELEQLAEEDILLRDPETGLVDFPGEVNGRRAFLCWRPDEDRVAYWHGPDSGFAGRRPL
jgi:hypothetical protein